MTCQFSATHDTEIKTLFHHRLCASEQTLSKRQLNAVIHSRQEEFTLRNEE